MSDLNLSFGKLDENENIVYAPTWLVIGRWTYSCPSEARYNQCGYYRIVYSTYPCDDSGNPLEGYIPAWELVDNQIIQTWVKNGVEA